MTWEIRQGDVLDRLREMPAESINCVVTSPPYWGLRDYGVAGQIGLERTPAEYVERIVEVFREVKRVLRKDGTCWLNLGDSFFGDSPARKASSDAFSQTWNPADSAGNGGLRRSAARANGLKPKDLVGIPWRVAFALQADGWWLRDDIIWAKPNPMPESITDRPTRSHEYVFLLTKSARYWYDAEAIKEEASPDTIGRTSQASLSTQEGGFKQGQYAQGFPGRKNRDRKPADILKHMHATGNGVLTRNARDVWTIATEPFAEAHFATFPTEIVRRCVLAGCPEHVCRECGKARARVQRPTSEYAKRLGKSYHDHQDDLVLGRRAVPSARVDGPLYETVGWTDCGHDAYVPGVVLDPFVGSGTTLMVASREWRSAIGIELKPDYVAMARKRIIDDASLLNSVAEAI